MYEILYAYNIATKTFHIQVMKLGPASLNNAAMFITTLDYATDVKISNITALTWVFERKKNEMSGFIASYKEPI